VCVSKLCVCGYNLCVRAVYEQAVVCVCEQVVFVRELHVSKLSVSKLCVCE